MLYMRVLVPTHHNKMVWWREDIDTSLKLQEQLNFKEGCLTDFGDFVFKMQFVLNRITSTVLANSSPFEVLYGRWCRSAIGWFDAFKSRPQGIDLL